MKKLGGQRYCQFCKNVKCWGECLTPKDERVFIVYTGDGKGNLVRIEETEEFDRLMKEAVIKFTDEPIKMREIQCNGTGKLGSDNNFTWNEDSREIL